MDDLMGANDAANPGESITVGACDHDRGHRLQLTDLGQLISKISHLQAAHPAAESDLKFESDFESEAESDSGWSSDLDSDSDSDESRLVPPLWSTSKQRGRLTVISNRLVDWRPSVLENFIKFRVYFREFNEGYTRLVSTSILESHDPFVFAGNLQASLHTHHLTKLCSEFSLLRQINRKMGESYRNVWWKELSQAGKRIRTEKEASYTKKNFGSHEDLSEEMKMRIATKVNNDEISYGRWKGMTQPTADESYDPSQSSSSAFGPLEPSTDETQNPSIATEQLNNTDKPGSGLTVKRIKQQRKKNQRRARKALGFSIAPTIISESSGFTKLTPATQVSDELVNNALNENKNRNSCPKETDMKVEGDVPVGISPDSSKTDSQAWEKDGASKADPADEIIDVASRVTLVKGKGRAVFIGSENIQTSQREDASLNSLAHKICPSDDAIDKGKAPVIGSEDTNHRNSSFRIPALSLQPSDIAIDKGEEKPTVEGRHLSDVAVDKEQEASSSTVTEFVIVDEEKEALLTNVTVREFVPSDLGNLKKQKALSSMKIAHQMTRLDVTPAEATKRSSCNAATQNPLNVRVTIHEENGKMIITPVPDMQVIHDNGTVSDRSSFPFRIILNPETDKMSSTAQPDRQTSRNKKLMDLTIGTGTEERRITALFDQELVRDCPVVSSVSPGVTNNPSNGIASNPGYDVGSFPSFRIASNPDAGVANNSHIEVTQNVTGESLDTIVSEEQQTPIEISPYEEVYQSREVDSNLNIQLLDETKPGEEEQMPIEISLNKKADQSIEVTKDQTSRYLETILTRERELSKVLSDQEFGQSIGSVNKSQDFINNDFKYTSQGNLSVTAPAANITSIVDFASMVAIPKKEHLDILWGQRKGKVKALIESLPNEMIDHSIEFTGLKSSNDPHITLRREKSIEKGTIEDADIKNDFLIGSESPFNSTYYSRNEDQASSGDPNNIIKPDIDTMSNISSQAVHVPASLSDNAKILVVNELNSGVSVGGKITARDEDFLEISPNTEKGKEPADISASEILSLSIGAASSTPKTDLAHFDETQDRDRGGKAPSNYLAGQVVAASSNTGSKRTTHEGYTSEASAKKSYRETQASRSTHGNPGHHLGSSATLLTQYEPARLSSKLSLAGVRGARGIKWAYFTRTIADEVLITHGIWLFEKPTTYFEYQPYHYVRRGLGLQLAPIAVATFEEEDVHEPHEPSVDVDNTGVWINTHDESWRDIRSKSTHPDFQMTSKLLEYQACESLGLTVWRHDRNLLKCRLTQCNVKIADHNRSTVICLVCGPKSITRYCSVQHQIKDLRKHWEECGHPELLMRRIIDAATSPARFDRLWPVIRDRTGNSSYERSRQATYAVLHRGKYTLFDPETEVPTALRWPSRDGRAAVMEGRMERLLNYALFDHKHGRITGLLYRMIRQCLIQKNFWVIGPIYAVKTQFAAEFGCDVSKVADWPLCECEWVGNRLPRERHVAGCKRLYLAYSAEYQATGIRGFLEMMEGRFWALRAWRQCLPTGNDREVRVSGTGFAGEASGVKPFLGPGWTGWGSPPDDLVD